MVALAEDPMRATFLAILRQLNQADVQHDSASPDQSLELAEIERRLSDFTPVLSGSVKVARALGLLLMNRLVAANADPEFSWQRGRTVAQRYQITPLGKQFLLENIERKDRVE